MKTPDESATGPLDASPFTEWAAKHDISPPLAKHDTGQPLAKLLSGSLPTIRLPQPGRLLSDFATELGENMKTKGIFNRGGVAVTLNNERLEVLLPETMRTWVENHVVCYFEKVAQAMTITLKQTMRKEDATGVLASVQFINQLPRLDSLNPVRLPVMRNLGSIELLPTGYDQESRTFTLSSSILYDEHLSLEQAQTSINDLLSEFCFAADNGRSKSVAVAAMFTIFARGLLHQDSLVPCFLYLANAEGAGKTTLAACAVSPVHGIPKNEGFPSNNDELEKRLTANVSEGVSYIVYDNVKGHVNSDKLEAFLTTPVWKGRVLGLSRTISASNCTTVLMTGNGTTISPDLRRRTLISELVMEAERAEDRKFKKLLDVPGLIERRAQVLSAMWAVVRAWDEAGRPKASRGNASFQRWTDVIGGIVEFGGWGCPVEPAKIDNGGDTELDDMRELVLAMSDGREMGFRSVVDLCRSRGLFDGLIPQDDDDGLDPKKKSVLGKIFGRYHERLFSGMVRFIVAGKGHARRYIARHENKPLSGEAPCPSVEPPQGSQGVSGDLESTLAS